FGVRKATLADGEHAGDGLTFVFEITHIIDVLHLAGALNVSQLRVRLVPIKPVPEAAQISIGRTSKFRPNTRRRRRMGRAAHWPDIWLIVLGSIILFAWWSLAHDSAIVSAFCSSDTLRALPQSVRLNLALVLLSPAQLASSSVLMIAAMMLPLTITPLRYVRDRSFARRRARATILFAAGYVVVWMIASVVLQLIAFAARWAAFAPPLCLGLAIATAIIWQVSPAKQWCLNRCHRRPHLAAFGTAADRDAFGFGLTNGASCAGSCWALMLATLLVGQGHVLAMLGVTLF